MPESLPLRASSCSQCLRCGAWVPQGAMHVCPMSTTAVPIPAIPVSGAMIPAMTSPERSADLHIEQQPNGYWLAAVVIRIPDLPEQEFRNELAHDAGEALDWARMTIENTVRAVSPPGWPT